jgi:hypothetical protein
MKKVLPLLFLLTLVINSCSPPDDGDTIFEPIDATLIIGTWDFVDSDIDVSTTLQVLGQDVTTITNVSAASSTTSITFNEDGSYSIDGSAEYVTSSTGVPDLNTTVDLTGTSGTYVITENTIVLSETDFVGGISGQAADEITPVYMISLLSTSRMVMEVGGSTVQDQLGQRVTLGLNGMLEWSK